MIINFCFSPSHKLLTFAFMYVWRISLSYSCSLSLFSSRLTSVGARQAGRIFHEWAQLPMTREEFLAKQAPLQEKYFSQCQPLLGVRTLLGRLAEARTRPDSRVKGEKMAENDVTAVPMIDSKTVEGKQQQQQQQHEEPRLHLALATSSHKGNFSLKTSHIADLFTVFAPEKRILGDDPRIPKGRGKPAPDIYLQALKAINEVLAKKRNEIQEQAERFSQPGEGAADHHHHLRPIWPEECLVFEDSVPGVEAGRRAGMQVVWCPHPGLLTEYKGKEELVLAGLMGEHEDGKGKVEGKEVDERGEESDGILEYLGCGNIPQLLNDDEKQKAKGRKVGQPGQIGDGWARLVNSLENFPYSDYGLKV